MYINLNFVNFNTCVYFLFVFSGLIKTLASDFLPFDITLFSAIYLFIVVLLNFKFSTLINEFLWPILCLFLLYFLITFSLIYTHSVSFYKFKYYASYMNLLAFLYPILARFNFNLFTRLLLVVSLVSFFVFYYYKITYDYSYLQSKGLTSAYLMIGLVIGFTILALRATGYSGGKNTLILYLLVFMLMASGARGPFIGVLLALSLSYLFYNRAFKFNLKNTAVLTLLLFITIWQYDTVLKLLSSFIDRFALLFEDGFGESINQRVFYFNQAIEMFINEPLSGYGFGSFSNYVFGVDGSAYPHNVFLEIMAETGIFGLLFLCSFFIVLFLKFKNEASFFPILFFALFNMSKSNSFHEMRIYFAMLAVFSVFCVLKGRYMEDTQ